MGVFGLTVRLKIITCSANRLRHRLLDFFLFFVCVVLNMALWSKAQQRYRRIIIISIYLFTQRMQYNTHMLNTTVLVDSRLDGPKTCRMHFVANFIRFSELQKF